MDDAVKNKRFNKSMRFMEAIMKIFCRSNYRFRDWKHPFEPLVQLFRDIRCCLQRITKGYCYRDVWSIDSWFLEVVPAMLEELKNTTHGCPAVLMDSKDSASNVIGNNDVHEEWRQILNEMVRLFREADEEACKRKNPYEEEYWCALEEFTEKYGIFGEKLQTAEERNEAEKKHFHTIHCMGELPEYRDIHEKYIEEEQKLAKYRDTCKDEALAMFSKWFWHLWD